MQQRNRSNVEVIKRKHSIEKASLEGELKRKDEDDRRSLSNLKDMTKQLTRDLCKLDMEPSDYDELNKSLEAARKTLECPICLETMRPPSKIWMCPSSHIICEPCREKLEERLCPTCRTDKVFLRAFMAENFARTLFND